MKPDNVRSQKERDAFDYGYRVGYADARRGSFSREILMAARGSSLPINQAWADGYETGAQAFIFDAPNPIYLRIKEWAIVAVGVIAALWLISKLWQ